MEIVSALSVYLDLSLQSLVTLVNDQLLTPVVLPILALLSRHEVSPKLSLLYSKAHSPWMAIASEQFSGYYNPPLLDLAHTSLLPLY